MKRLLWSTFLVLVMTLFSDTVLASDVSNALWRGNIEVSNNGTATTAVSTNISSLNSTSLIDNDFATANLSDTAIQINGTDTAFMPGYENNSWMVFVPTIGATQNVNYDLYTGGATDGKIRYFPDSGGMTTSDHSSLEPGGNFTIKLKGYYTDGIQLEKEDAITIEYDSGSVIAALDPSVSTWTTPTGDVDNGWDAPEDAYDDDTGTYAYYAIAQSWTPFLELTIAEDTYNSIRFMVGHLNSTINLVDVDVYYSSAWHNEYQADGPWGEWISVALGDNYEVSKMRIRCYHSSGTAYQSYIYEADFGLFPRVEATMSEGEHEVEVRADGSYLTLHIDGGDASDNMSLGGASVPDNANNWITGASGSMLYIEYQEISIGGVQRQYIDWEYDDTTFTDSSGNNNDATPTFRTTSSSANISANLTSFQPVEESKVATFDLSETYSILTANATFPTEMYSELDTSKIPGGEAVDELLAAGEVPQAAWWYPFLFLGICVIGLITYGGTTLTRSRGGLSEGQIDGSLLTMFIVMEVLLAIISFMGPIPFWPAILFPIPGIAIILSRKHFSWG